MNGAEVQGRPYSQGISMRACTSKDYIPIGDKGIAVYLDGVRVPFGLQGVNDLVRPDENPGDRGLPGCDLGARHLEDE